MQDVAQQRAEKQSFQELKAACDHVLTAWLKPDWRRIKRDEAKRLLVKSRQESLSESRKLEILNKYLGEALERSEELSPAERLEARYQKFRKMGDLGVDSTIGK